MRLDAGTLSEGELADSERFAPWFRSRAAWRFAFARFVPLLAAGNLVWEIFQLPFYTLWAEGTPQSRAFAVAHCTIGDVMIGTAALLASVMPFGRRGWPRFGHERVLAAATFASVAYTVFSEWLNTQVTMGWQCSEAMLRVPPLGTGLTPLLQWIIIPPLVYWLARGGAHLQPRGGQAK
jgi:hypothetical protein